MATADELLAGHSSGDNKTLVIDNDLRTINIPSGVKVLGVASDDEVLRLNFKMPRYVSNTDLSTFSIRINYTNAKNVSDLYTVRDKVVGIDDITFTWLVGPIATQVKGSTKFNVCAVKLDSDGNIDKEFNTTIVTLDVLEGLEANPKAVTKYSDVIEQWRSELFGIGDTEEANIILVSEEQQAAMVAKGEEVLASIPEDYTTTYKMAEEALRTKADGIVCEAEGNVIIINDSSDDYIRGLNVYGKSTQVTTTGRNVLDVEENFTWSGTYSKDIAIPAGSYVITWAGSTPGGDNAPQIRFVSNDKWILLGTSGGSVTMDFARDETHIYVYSNGSSYDNSEGVESTVTQLMVSADGGTYEPYTGGMAAPNPDYPQEIVSIENPTVKMYGTNIFDVDTFVNNALNNGVLTAIQKVENSIQVMVASYLENLTKYDFGFEPDTQYTISFDAHWDNATNDTAQLSVLFYYTDGTNTPVTINYIDGDKTYTVASKSGKTVASIAIGTWRYAGLCVLRNINLVKGGYDSDTMPVYEVCMPQTLTLVNTLHGVPVIRGGSYTTGNYVDDSGQQWICDEVDLDRGVYVQRILVQEFTGEEAWTINPLSESLGTTAYHIYNPNGDMEFVFGLCSHFVNAGPWSSGLTSKTNAFWTANATTVVFKTDGSQSLDDFLSFIRNEYESGTPVTLYSVLRTPIETPLTAEEIAAYKALNTNYPNTTVMNDQNAHMAIRYNADTLIYLRDNQPKPTDEQVKAAVYEYADENGIQVPSDDHIKDLIAAAHNSLLLQDTSTSRIYKLTVDSGILTMTEV